ncbi:MAG: SusC/RagA family TonB-linked outer membrane protein [Prevotella sp.]|nr:SusC/RagA family TonB-linked outer membrane protein [Prevotella sp.]
MKKLHLRKLLVAIAALFISIGVQAQQNVSTGIQQGVSGQVTDENGEPIVGAIISVPGTKKVTVSDSEGKFFLNQATSNDLVEISYMGKKTVRRKAGSKPLSITVFDDATLMDEVVVTGYQTISRERATGAFGKVSSEHLSQPTSNIGERLVGTISGLASTTDANGDISFQIRGLSTLVASNKDPLLIVDGFPVEASISSLNPNNIEKIDVLKDAAAASIWGAKAANGVIVVTTKDGKDARNAKGGVKVTFNSMLKFSPKIDNDYYSANASNQELIDWQIYTFQNKDFGRMALIGDGNSNNNLRYNYNSYSNLYVMLNENRLGYVSDSELQAYIAKIRTQDNSDQIKDYLLASPFTQQYDLNISQSSERVQSNFSLLYENQQQYLKGNSKNKYTFNANAKVNVYKWLDFSVNGTFHYNHQTNNGVAFTGPAFELFFDENGDYTDVVRPYTSRNDRTFYTPNVHRYLNWTAFPYPDFGYNPVQEQRGRDYTTNTINARVQAALNFKLAKGINFETKFQYEILNTDTRNIDDETTFATRSTININSTSDKTPTGAVTPNLPPGSILKQDRSYTDAYNWRNQFNFNRTFAERHEVTFIAGTEISDRVFKTVVNPPTYGYNDETLSVGKVTSLTYKNYFGSNTTFSNYVNSYTYQHDRYFSAYGNLAYTFDGKYTLSGSVRTDASNLITDDPSYRYAPFWSIGGKWIASKEQFAKDWTWLNLLAVRLTYGFNGNVDRSTSIQPVIQYNTSQDVLLQDYTATISSYGNPTLRWEKTGTVDLGFDVSILGGKLTAKLDLYNKKGRDLLATFNLPAVTGAASNRINAAEMTNRGFELELGTYQRFGEVTWRGALMLSYNKNTIDKMIHTTYTGFELSGQAEDDSGKTPDVRYREGYNANTLWSYAYGGLINTGTEQNPAWYPSVMQGDNKVPLVDNQTEDWSDYMVNSGVSVAPWNSSFSSTISWRDFDLSFLFTGKFGHKFRRLTFNYAMYAALLPNKDMAEVISQDGSKYIPFAAAPYSDYTFASSSIGYDMNWWSRYSRYMDYGVESASLIRFQEITLAYNVPRKLINKIGIGGVKVYLKGNNLHTFTFNKYDEDPEFPLGTIRPVSSYTFGLNITL